jgi:hypothetical protein
MKMKSVMLAGVCALAGIGAGIGAAGAGRAAAIDAKLSGTGIAEAAGTARMTLEGARRRFSIEVRGLEPGACELLVGGAREGFLFVDARGRGEITFDSRLIDEEAAGGPEESEAIALSFDPRGRLIQVARDGQVLLEVMFPSRPSAGRRPTTGSQEK